MTVQARNGKQGPKVDFFKKRMTFNCVWSLISTCIFQMKREKKKNIVLGTPNPHLPFSITNEGRPKSVCNEVICNHLPMMICGFNYPVWPWEMHSTWTCNQGCHLASKITHFTVTCRLGYADTRAVYKSAVSISALQLQPA